MKSGWSERSNSEVFEEERKHLRKKRAVFILLKKNTDLHSLELEHYDSPS